MSTNFLKFVVLKALLLPFIAVADVNSRDCEKQLENLLATSVSCTLDIRPDSLKEIVSVANGIVKDASCRIPLNFEKSAVYGRWIKENSVNLPRLKVVCLLISTTEETLAVNSYIQPACSRAAGQDWKCSINMSGTEGLGVLGAILETQVNNSEGLKAKMKQFLTSMPH